ncbi:NAD(+) diphosphatase [Lysobacter sp. HDW10]|uniref:NAD(+) diphosphatase n=1 Tax=Lysobacter sp. HDW10 TaxID=2714936 RepID=UPI00140E70B5|nr:NAD(+) diphosphatase [Lysobacter sp. HDW10]QIK80556.1 NAD(+) diphosphatase [Lysobacter sp. HDW10]
MKPYSDFAFVEHALDRADHLRDDAQALDALRANAKTIVVDPNGFTRVDAEGQLLALEGAAPADIFLGLHEGTAWFAHALADALPNDVPSTELRSAALQWPVLASTAFAQARAIVHWHRSHIYCPKCGGELKFSRAGWQADCLRCAATQYPRTDPAVIMAVSDGEHILLGRHPSWPPHRYSTLAGFVEPGESLELTVRREVMEETGVHVVRTRYLASQPWPFPGSLMLGFVAHAEHSTPRVDGQELEDARWFSRAEIQAALANGGDLDTLKLSPPLSISRWLIEQWAKGESA